MTPFGEYNKGYRKEHGITQADMAKELGISAQFLSALEVGKSRIPYSVMERYCDRFDLTDNERAGAKAAVFETNNNVEIDISKFKGSKREVIIQFACLADGMDEVDATRLKCAMDECSGYKRIWR
ncbi:MAG: helix-turn-helix domain-containing protein [Clostridia bacterium]|nr:helix-turn-helix domain-containing protein [Clostridia bacterium]